MHCWACPGFLAHLHFSSSVTISPNPSLRQLGQSVSPMLRRGTRQHSRYSRHTASLCQRGRSAHSPAGGTHRRPRGLDLRTSERDEARLRRCKSSTCRIASAALSKSRDGNRRHRQSNDCVRTVPQHGATCCRAQKVGKVGSVDRQSEGKVRVAVTGDGTKSYWGRACGKGAQMEWSQF